MAHLTKSSYTKIVLIILLCLVICGSLTGGFALIHNAMNSWRSSWDEYRQSWIADSNAASGSFTVSASEVSDMDINWLAGNVVLSVVDDSQTSGMIRVTETEDPRLPLRWRNESGRLEIDYGDMRGLASCSMFHQKGKDLEILIPESRANSLGSLTLNAASGEYSLNGLACKTLAVNQASGYVHLDDFAADDAAFEVASGRVVYNGKVKGDLSADLASGNMQINLSEYNPAASDMTLASGDIVLMLPIPDFCVELSRMSGNFSSDFELLSKGDTFYCSPEDNGEGSSAPSVSDRAYRNGSQPRIEVDMMSGSFFIGKSQS